MIVHLDCGCTVNDEYTNTVHEMDGRHYPLGTSPQTFCLRCDRFHPSCDLPAAVKLEGIARVRRRAGY